MEMDKFDLVLDVVEHPDKYSSVELEDFLRDREFRELYEAHCILSIIESYRKSPLPGDIDDEWKRFKRSKRSRFSLLPFFGNRVAVVVTIVSASLMAVAAIGFGLKHTVLSDRITTSEKTTVEQAQMVGDSIHYAEVDMSEDSINVDALELSQGGNVVFVNETLEKIIGDIAYVNGVDVKFKNPGKRSLRLYFQWNTEESMSDIVRQLNNFEQISITCEGNTIIVE